MEEQIGRISHYFAKISVGIIAVGQGELKVGDRIHVKGHTSDFFDESIEFKSISSHRELRSRNYYDYGASVNHANRFGAMVQPLRSFMPRGSEILDAFARHEQWQLSQEFQLVGG